MADLPDVLTRELGSSLPNDIFGGTSNYEENPELRWPLSTAVYDRMRKTDGQVASVRRARDLPIRRAKWKVAGADVEPKVNKFVEANLGLQIDENGRRRTSDQGFSWDNFLRTSLIHLDVGHMPFEKTYAIADGRDELTGLPIRANLARLSPRMPRTIADFVQESNGDLRAIKQWVQRRVGTDQASSWLQDKVTIPTESLVMFVNDQEGADFTGQSVLRSAWIDWTIKSKLIRLNAIGIERNSVGVPKVTVPDGGSEAKGHRIGREFRATERSHVVVSEGYDVELLGTTGSLRDPLPSIKYHDEMIGRSALAMFLNLGHDRGSQSLGETFLDLFTASLNAVVDYIEEVVAEQVVRDLVRINFGENEPYPAVIADDITPENALTPEDMATLINAGALTPDGELEDDTRRRHGLPKANPARRPKPIVVTPPPDPAQNSDPNGPQQRPEGQPQPSTDAPPKGRIAAARSHDDLVKLEARAAALRSSIVARRRAEELVSQ